LVLGNAFCAAAARLILLASRSAGGELARQVGLACSNATCGKLGRLGASAGRRVGEVLANGCTPRFFHAARSSFEREKFAGPRVERPLMIGTATEQRSHAVGLVGLCSAVSRQAASELRGPAFKALVQRRGGCVNRGDLGFE
jgi:hypothetical protein